MFSCSKEEDAELREDLGLFGLIFRNEIDQEADIFITAQQQYPNTTATTATVIIQGAFKNVNNKALLVAVNSFTVNNSVINSTNIGGKVGYFKQDGLSGDMFGNIANINIIGNASFPSVQSSVILPKIISIQSIPNQLTKTQDFNISWTPTSDSTSQVGVFLWYKGYKSNKINPSLPSANQSILFSVPDTGNYTIPHSQFVNFPLGGIAHVVIFRWREQVINIDTANDIELVVHAASICYSDDLEIVQ